MNSASVLILVSLGLLLVRILDNFNVNGRLFNTVELPTYDGPYIVLETLDREKNLVNGCYLLDMSTQKSFKLGRDTTQMLE